jgi:hypothetical protein
MWKTLEVRHEGQRPNWPLPLPFRSVFRMMSLAYGCGARQTMAYSALAEVGYSWNLDFKYLIEREEDHEFCANDGNATANEKPRC